MNLNPKRKRSRRPAEAGRHTRTAKTAGHLGGATDETYVFPAVPALPSRTAQLSTEDRDDARRHGAHVRPAVTASWQISAPGADVLRRFADGLRALPPNPGAYLRAIMPDGHRPWESLNGDPVYAGLVEGADGRRYAGLYLGDEDQDGRLVIDATRQWLLALRDAADVALAAMGAEVDEALTSLESDLDAEGRPAA